MFCELNVFSMFGIRHLDKIGFIIIELHLNSFLSLCMYAVICDGV